MLKGRGLKVAQLKGELWRRIRRQLPKELEKQEASLKRCWHQKDRAEEGQKKEEEDRRRKDLRVRRRCGG